MCRHNEYIKAREKLAVELRRDPTPEEIENAMADRAAGIDAAYEQARADAMIVEPD